MKLVYKMDHEFRGKAVIFNNLEFDHADLSKRIGSKKDADDMEKVLKKLDFDVDKYVDFTLTQIRNKLRKIAEDRDMNADSDCLLVVVLSHGGDDDLIAAQ